MGSPFLDSKTGFQRSFILKINFPSQDPNENIINTTQKNAKAPFLSDKKGSVFAGNDAFGASGGIRLDLGNSRKNPYDYGLSGDEKAGGKSLEQIQLEAGNIDVSSMTQFNVVMANTMSSEDYAKASEDGFDYGSMDPSEVCTIQDRVKAEMAKGGTVIAGYNDDFGDESLINALGGGAQARELANEVKAAFARADLSITPENAENIAEGWKMATELRVPEDSEVSYMIENGSDISVRGFYEAEFSGATSAHAEQGNSVATLDAPENTGLKKQIEGLLESTAPAAGVEEYIKDGLKNAEWLLGRDLPVTEETLRKVADIKKIDFPISEKDYAESAAAAVASGKLPKDADLTVREDIYSAAARIESRFFSAEIYEEFVGDIKLRRQLEEVRLSMTAEVNVKLLSSGFSIDTAPMEQLIDALKEAEKSVAEGYFPERDDAVSSYRLMNETNTAVQEIKISPADTLGMFVSAGTTNVNFEEFHTEGKVLRDTYIKAGESYEALMTAPRADLGDSIRKAFANVDDIVKDLDLDLNEENRRAVRILGYNRMEINEENIKTVSEADARVTSVIERMKPAAVLGMIRDGFNPLEKDFVQIEEYLNTAEENRSYDEKAKSYSEYLYALDRSGEITDEERESYIGIYRMIHGIESSDGAAIGAMVNEGAIEGFESLLSAVRSNKFKGLDVKVSDSLGVRSDIIRAGRSITDQIESAYRDENRQAFIREYREAVQNAEEAGRLLSDAGIKGSADNLIAAKSLLSGEDELFGKLAKARDKKSERKLDMLTRLSESEDALNEYTDMIEDLEKEVEEITFSGSKGLDIRDLRLIHRQLSVCAALPAAGESTGREEYFVPAEIGGEIRTVRLVFDRDAGRGQNVDIYTEISDGEPIEAHFTVNEGTIGGYIIASGREALQKSEKAADIFSDLTNNESGMRTGEIGIFERNEETARSLHRSHINQYVTGPSKDAEGNISEGSDRRALFGIAKNFLSAVGEGR